ncbi:MAG: hypothetical protein AB8F95_12775 [Bacteroidia bacterium]
MSLFTKTQHQYFASDQDIPFDGSEESEYFCALFRIDKKATKKALAYTRLTFDKKNLLKKKETFFEGELDEERALTPEEHRFTLTDYPVHTPGHFFNDPNGLHQMGGEAPGSMKLPSLKGTPVVYWGFVNHQDPTFSWLGTDLHLICPIFLSLEEFLYVDYSDPDKPVFLNKTVIEDTFDNPFDHINEASNVSYAAQKMRAEQNNIADHVEGSKGYAGVPDWDHEVLFPRCPKTNARMRFVMYSLGNGDCKLVSDSPEVIQETSEESLFFGDGKLHVFFNPDSKVAAYAASYS